MGLNHYTEVLTYLKKLADEDDFVNTVTQDDMSEVDLNKMNIFNLVHIDVLGGGFSKSHQTVSFDVEIMCGQLRDSNKQDDGEKFFQQDNLVDNMNETHAVLNRMWFKLVIDFTNQNINIVDDAPLVPIKEYGKNLIDGWLMTFTIELPNTTINLCQ